MFKCAICGQNRASKFLKVCKNCIINHFSLTKIFIEKAQEKSRSLVYLPYIAPKQKNGVMCSLCSNKCILGEGDTGFCGLRKNIGGIIQGPSKAKAKLHAYYGLNPTNCCAAWFCPASTGAGYPCFTEFQNGERYTYNYSIFFYGCNFNCLFCQNYSHKTEINDVRYSNIEDIFEKCIRKDVTCICFFGGSPEPHFPFALELSKRCLEYAEKHNRILRICWEWNGAGNPKFVKKAAEFSLKSGGIMKFDLKAFDNSLAKALLGVDIMQTYQNFKKIAEMIGQRPEIPLLTATTLLVSYYIDEDEVEKIAQFIAEISDEIPYSLLVFHPDFLLRDLPITPLDQVKKCYAAAKRHLKHVHVGNLHILGINESDLLR